MTKNEMREYIKAHLIDGDISYRGGGLKINVSPLFPEIPTEDAVMGTSQNYLGGGIAGSITGGAMFEPSELTKAHQKQFFALLEACKRYHYELNGGGGDEYMVNEVNSYEKNQLLPERYPGL